MVILSHVYGDAYIFFFMFLLIYCFCNQEDTHLKHNTYLDIEH